MLSNLMGRDQLNKGLAELIQKFPAGSSDSPLLEDLIEIVRAHAPDKSAYDQFINQWVKGSVMPDLQWLDVKLTKLGEKDYQVTGKLKNSGTGTVMVAIATTTGKRFKKKNSVSETKSEYQTASQMVKIEAGQSSDFSIQSSFTPEKVVFDPDFQLLLRGRDRSERKLSQ
jgi:predicted NACHT family NTPase